MEEEKEKEESRENTFDEMENGDRPFGIRLSNKNLLIAIASIVIIITASYLAANMYLNTKSQSGEIALTAERLNIFSSNATLYISQKGGEKITYSLSRSKTLSLTETDGALDIRVPSGILAITIPDSIRVINIEAEDSTVDITGLSLESLLILNTESRRGYINIDSLSADSLAIISNEQVTISNSSLLSAAVRNDGTTMLSETDVESLSLTSSSDRDIDILGGNIGIITAELGSAKFYLEPENGIKSIVLEEQGALIAAGGEYYWPEYREDNDNGSVVRVKSKSALIMIPEGI